MTKSALLTVIFALGVSLFLREFAILCRSAFPLWKRVLLALKDPVLLSMLGLGVHQVVRFLFAIVDRW